MTAYAPAWAVWLALGLWGVAGCVAAAAILYARAVWRRLAPSMLPLLAMLGFGGTLPQATATGATAESGQISVAVPDRCEYDDHVWSSEPVVSDRPSHYCVLCGYTEPIPGL